MKHKSLDIFVSPSFSLISLLSSHSPTLYIQLSRLVSTVERCGAITVSSFKSLSTIQQLSGELEHTAKHLSDSGTVRRGGGRRSGGGGYGGGGRGGGVREEEWEEEDEEEEEEEEVGGGIGRGQGRGERGRNK